MDTAPNHAEKLCAVTLSDPTDPPQNGLRLSIMFSSVDSLRMKRRLYVGELDVMLSACGPVLQMAKLGVENLSYEHRLNSVMTFMDTHQQVSQSMRAFLCLLTQFAGWGDTTLSG
jgi:hypothetical protein